MIYILSGNIRTGKTTALLEWSKGREDLDGVLCPDASDGKRYFLKIKSQEIVPLEVSIDSNEVITIGNFRFLKSSFKTANEFLISTKLIRNSKYLIIDELGKLELQNEGLHEAAKKMIPIYESDKNHHLILVIRTSLLEDIIQKYKIEDFKLIQTEDLIKSKL